MLINIIVWIILGALAGWIASIIMGRNRQMGAIANIIVGIIGALIGLAVLGIITIFAVLAPLIAPYAPNKLSVVNRLKPPSERWWFGTDQFGRDVFSRIIFSSQISLTVGLIGVLLSLVFGAVLGLVSGYFGGWIDDIIQRIIELVRSIPNIPLWMALSAAIPSTWSPLLKKVKIKAETAAMPLAVATAATGAGPIRASQNMFTIS